MRKTLSPQPIGSPRKLASSACSAFLRLETFIAEHTFLTGTLLFLICLARAFVVSRHRNVISDELLTYAEAQLPSLNALWSTLKNLPTALDPPLNPFLSFLALRLALPFPLNLRLPAILGYSALVLCVFIFVRKRASVALAVIAASVLLLAPAFEFAVEARPYGLMLGAAGCALLSWQCATERAHHRLVPMAGLCASIASALLSQYFGVLIFLPLAAGELWRSIRRRRIDYAIWAVFAIASLAMAIYIPLLPAAALYRAHPWHAVLVDDLKRTYLLGIEPLTLVTITLCALLWIRGRRRQSADSGVVLLDHEAVAIGAFYVIPLGAFLMAKMFTHSYVPRYGLMFVIGASCLLAVVIGRLTSSFRSLAFGIAVLLVSYSALPAVKALMHTQPQDTGDIDTSATPILEKFPGLTIAVPGFDPYVRFCVFGRKDDWQRMVLVSDPFELTAMGNTITLASKAVGQALSRPQARYDEFVRSHSRFLVLTSFWLDGRLIRDGWQIVHIGEVAHYPLYLATKPGAALGNAR